MLNKLKINISNALFRAFSIMFIFILIGFASITLSSCSEDNNTQSSTSPFRSVNEIQQSGYIKIGVFIDKSPFGYLDKDGKNTGFDIYYGDQLAEDLGVKVEYVPVDAAARVSSLEAHKVDVILANFTVTPERRQKVDFTNAYMKVALGLASHKDQPIDDLLTLQNSDKKLVIVKGTTAETYLEKEYPQLLIKALKFDQYAQVQEALNDGRADAWLTDNTEAISFAKANSNFVVSSGAMTIGTPDTIAPAVAKGNTDLQFYINNEIKQLTTSGFFQNDYLETLNSVYGSEFESQLLLSPQELEYK